MIALHTGPGSSAISFGKWISCSSAPGKWLLQPGLPRNYWGSYHAGFKTPPIATSARRDRLSISSRSFSHCSRQAARRRPPVRIASEHQTSIALDDLAQEETLPRDQHDADASPENDQDRNSSISDPASDFEHVVRPVSGNWFSDFAQVHDRIHHVTGYKFIDGDYLRAALYDGPIIMGGMKVKDCNYQFAMLGDSLLKTIWYADNLPRDVVGKRSTITAYEGLASNLNLAGIATRLALWDLMEPKILTAHDVPTLEDRSGAHRLGTLIESLLGAIFYDSNNDIEAVRKAINQIWYHSEQYKVDVLAVVSDGVSNPPTAITGGRSRNRRHRYSSLPRIGKKDRKAMGTVESAARRNLNSSTPESSDNAASDAQDGMARERSGRLDATIEKVSGASPLKLSSKTIPESHPPERSPEELAADAAAIASLQANVEAISGHAFKDPTYFTAALTRIPQVIDGITYDKLRVQLALLGDALLREQYYSSKFPMPDDDPVIQSPLSIAVRKCPYWDSILARQAGHLGLRNHPELVAARNFSLAYRLKALVGAIHLDSGEDLRVTKRAIAGMLSAKIVAEVPGIDKPDSNLNED